MRAQARAALAAKTYDEAMRLFADASAAAPQDASLHHEHGVALVLGGRLVEAGAAFAAALRADSTYEPARRDLDRLTHKLRADERDGDIATAARRARDHLQGGRYALAEAEASRVLIDRPDAPETLVLRGRARLELGHSAAARRDFLRALKLDPGSVDALRGAAETFRLEGDSRRAAYYLELAAATTPDTQEARRAERQARDLRQGR